MFSNSSIDDLRDAAQIHCLKRKTAEFTGYLYLRIFSREPC